MRAIFKYESIERYLKPKSGKEIIKSLSSLSKKELDKKLIDAARNGPSNVIQYLIKAGADINIKTRFGHTALHLAAYYGHEQIVKMLLDAGSDINAKNNVGQTALYWALLTKNKNTIDLLKSYGAKE